MKENSTGVKRERAKRLLVSIYGKFAQLNEIEKFNPETNSFETEITDYPLWTNIIYSAIVTDESRKLLRFKMGKQPYYVDTDSFLSKEKLQTSNQLGDIKLEGTFTDINIILPKAYIFRNKKMIKVKLKGIPKRVYVKEESLEKDNLEISDVITKRINEIIKGKTVYYTRPIGIKTALKTKEHPAKWKEDSKSIVSHYDKRLILSDGNTRALFVDMRDSKPFLKGKRHGKTRKKTKGKAGRN